MQWLVTRLVGLGAALLVTAALLLLATMYARTNWPKPTTKPAGEVIVNLTPQHASKSP